MPDDIEVTEQNDDVLEEEDAMAAFDEEAGAEDGEEGVAPENPDESDDDDDPDKEEPSAKSDDKGGDDDDPDKKGEPDGDDDDPEKRLEKILADREAGEKPNAPAKPDEPEKPDAPDEPEKPSGPIPVSIDQVNGFNQAISVDQLPDANVVIGKDTDGKEMKINLREFAQEEPEMFAMAKAVSGAMTSTVLRYLVDSGVLLTGKDGNAVVQPVNETVQQLQDTIDDLQFEREVGYLGHPDYVQINRSKEFADWLDTQPASVRNMAKSLREPKEAATILDLYKKSTAESAVKEVDDKAAKKKAKKDALHRDTSRKPVKERTKPTGEEEVDEKSAFEEEAAALDKRDKR